MSEEDHEIIQCCFNKNKECLERVYELLQSERVDPFYLDDNGLSGLDYLLMPDSEGHNSGYFLVSYRVYTDLLIKYIKLYYENNPNEQVLNRNLQKICTNPQLLESLEQPLRRDVGILLHTYCKPAKPADGAEVMKGTYAEGEAYESLPLAEQMEYGISMPVPPERTYVTEEEEEEYVAQPMPADLRSYREAEKRGGLRKKKNNKRTKKGSKKGSKKGKSKKTKRNSRKSRN
jgi:hypothetical protein